MSEAACDRGQEGHEAANMTKGRVKLMLFNKNLVILLCGDGEGKRGSFSFVCHKVKPASVEPV